MLAAVKGLETRAPIESTRVRPSESRYAYPHTAQGRLSRAACPRLGTRITRAQKASVGPETRGINCNRPNDLRINREKQCWLAK